MNKTWLFKKGNKKCILFFNGWAMDENVVKHIDANGYDICMFNNYNTISTIDEDLNNYSAVYVVAWSLGVWVSAKILTQSNIEITKAIAFNGTQRPIDVKRGIPPLVFKTTLDTWDERNSVKFNMRVFGGRIQYERLSNRHSVRRSDDKKSELSNILKEVYSNTIVEMKFDCAIIGSNDLIFAPENQLNYWKNKTRIVKMDVQHYPFESFNKWKDIIEL